MLRGNCDKCIYVIQLYKRGMMLDGLLVMWCCSSILHICFCFRGQVEGQKLDLKGTLQLSALHLHSEGCGTSEPSKIYYQGSKLSCTKHLFLHRYDNCYFAKASEFGIMLTEGCYNCCLISLILLNVSKTLSNSVAGTRFRT